MNAGGPMAGKGVDECVLRMPGATLARAISLAMPFSAERRRTTRVPTYSVPLTRDVGLKARPGRRLLFTMARIR
jgi:hypothetical protein